MNKQGSIYVKKEDRIKGWCFCYHVYWKEQRHLDLRLWNHKAFATLKTAKAFAKKMWKEHRETELKPYIIKTIVSCDFFKEELYNTLEKVDPADYEYGNYAKKVW